MTIETDLDVLSSQYRALPKFTEWLTAPLQMLQDAQDLVNDMPDYFDIDLAIGDQLDILGEIIGVKREVTFEPTGGASPILDDDDYRIVLKAKIAKNQWRGTIPELYTMWNNLFPLQPIIIQDNQDMTMDVITFGFTTTMQQDLVNNGYIIPKPETVGINYYFATPPIFAYDLDNDTFKGYDEASWASSEVIST